MTTNTARWLLPDQTKQLSPIPRAYGPSFGGGHVLYISDNCHVNIARYSNLGKSYKLPAGYVYDSDEARRLLAGTYNFKVDEYEVFYQP